MSARRAPVAAAYSSRGGVAKVHVFPVGPWIWAADNTRSAHVEQPCSRPSDVSTPPSGVSSYWPWRTRITWRVGQLPRVSGCCGARWSQFESHCGYGSAPTSDDGDGVQWESRLCRGPKRRSAAGGTVRRSMAMAQKAARRLPIEGALMPCRSRKRYSGHCRSPSTWVGDVVFARVGSRGV